MQLHAAIMVASCAVDHWLSMSAITRLSGKETGNAVSCGVNVGIVSE